MQFSRLLYTLFPKCQPFSLCCFPELQNNSITTRRSRPIVNAEAPKVQYSLFARKYSEKVLTNSERRVTIPKHIRESVGMVDKHVWGACGYAVWVRVPSLAPKYRLPLTGRPIFLCSRDGTRKIQSNLPGAGWAIPAGRNCLLTICLRQIGNESHLSPPFLSNFPPISSLYITFSILSWQVTLDRVYCLWSHREVSAIRIIGVRPVEEATWLLFIPKYHVRHWNLSILPFFPQK